MEKVSMSRSMFPKLLILLSTTVFIAPAHADWMLGDSSRIGFVSIKNNSIGENNVFKRVSGNISERGRVSVSVDLSSVGTGIGIRNERLQKMLFEVANFPTATIEAVLSDSQVAVLKAGGDQPESVSGNISLHGRTVSKTAHVSVSASGGDVRVTTTQPIVITAQEFGLEAGVAALQQIAGLNAISRSIPVTVDLSLSAD